MARLFAMANLLCPCSCSLYGRVVLELEFKRNYQKMAELKTQLQTLRGSNS